MIMSSYIIHVEYKTVATQTWHADIVCWLRSVNWGSIDSGNGLAPVRRKCWQNIFDDLYNTLSKIHWSATENVDR